MYIYADNGKENLAAATSVTGWCPVITGITVGEEGRLIVGASVSALAKAWGTPDDFYLYRK